MQEGNKTLIDYRVKSIKKLMRLFRIFLFAFMFAVCTIMGISPVIPKRKEQFEIEVKMDEKEIDTKETIILSKLDESLNNF